MITTKSLHLASRSEDINRSKKAVAMLLGVAALGMIPEEAPIALTVVMLSTIVSIRLWRSMGRDIALGDLAAFIAVLQWIVCPYIAFHFPLYQASEYAMSGTLQNYMTFAAPGTAMFILGINLGRISHFRPLAACINAGPQQTTVAFLLVVSALTADLISSFSPSSIQFALKVLSDLKFGAIIIFLYSNHRLKWPLIVIFAVFTMLRSRNVGMFHESLLWSAIFTLYAFYRYADPRRPVAAFIAKIVVVLIATVGVAALQSVKGEFRTALSRGDNISLLKMSVDKAMNWEEMTSEDSLASILVRFNQGWIISRILENIPRREPFLNGESFSTAVEAVFMPRILFPDRAPIEISQRFLLFTGVRINDTTCMGVSLLGEAYGNFGRWGGLFAMVALGWIISSCIEYAKSLLYRWPLIFFLLGVMFSEPLKAETDSTMVLNYIAKSAVVVAFLVYLFRHSFTPKAVTTEQFPDNTPVTFETRAILHQ